MSFHTLLHYFYCLIILFFMAEMLFNPLLDILTTLLISQYVSWKKTQYEKDQNLSNQCCLLRDNTVVDVITSENFLDC